MNYSKDGIIVKCKFKETARFYFGADQYAALFGALAECSYSDVDFNGCTCVNGIGRPSVSHYNGYGMDFHYLWSETEDKKPAGSSLHIDTNWSMLDLDRQNKLHKALLKFGYGTIPEKASAKNMKKFDGFGTNVKEEDFHIKLSDNMKVNELNKIKHEDYVVYEITARHYAVVPIHFV